MSHRPIVIVCILGIASITSLVPARAVAPQPSFPDLTGLEPAVTAQLQELQQILLDTLIDQSATAADQAEVYGELGRHYHAYQLTVPAEAFYNYAQELIEDPSDWTYYLAHLLLAQGRLQEAEEHFRRFLEFQPHHLPTLVGLANLYLQENRLDNAESVIERAIEVDSDSPAVHTATGELALARGQYARAVEAFQRALELVPAADRLHYLLGMSYRGMGNTDLAREHLAERGPTGVKVADPMMASLHDLKRGESTYLLRGRRAYGVRRYPEAVNAFQQAVEAAPNSVRARVNLGSALAAAGDRSAAIVQFEIALGIDSSNATAWFNLGSLRASEGDFDRARFAFRAAIEIDPKDMDAHSRLGDLFLQSNHLDSALDYYRQAIALDPSTEMARLGEADALGRLGSWPQAREVLEEAHRLMPTSGLIAEGLTRLLTQSPDPAVRDGARALPIALRVFEARSTAGSARTVALAFADLGQCEEAATWQGRAVSIAEVAAEFELAEELRGLLASYPWTRACHSPRED